MPGTENVFTTRVDPISPPPISSLLPICTKPTFNLNTGKLDIGGGAGYCPRVRYAYSTTPFSAIAGSPA